MTRRTRALALALIALAPLAARADGPADNVPTAVRRIPKPGITVAPEVRTQLQSRLDALKAKVDGLPDREKSPTRELLPDVAVLHKAVDYALRYDEFFAPEDVGRARGLLDLADQRVAALAAKKADWPRQTGLVVRGYVSKIDGSVQPYGLVVPPSYTPDTAGRYRLDVWFHGRGEVLSEVNFLDQRRKQVGEFAPPDTIVLHPYGRYCNANKFAGEVDVLEAIDAVKRHYRIDDDRVSARGFSMGGAAAWQFAVHYPDHWFAANPGAGFAESARFLNVFQRETLKPTWYEQALWHLYDCTDYALNLAQCPTIAYSGSLDSQKQAADVMAEALQKEGIDLVHVIGQGARHNYNAEGKAEVERRMSSLAVRGRQRVPGEVHFVTYTLRYNRSHWVTVDGLGEHWKRAQVDASIRPEGGVEVKTRNVTALTLGFDPGFAPFPVTGPVRVVVDGQTVEAPRPGSDRSWSVSLILGTSGWRVGNFAPGAPRKVHGIQGPVDDAFMDAFVFVRPTGKSSQPKVQAWAEAELAHAVEHWRRHFRGDARVVDDTIFTDAMAANTNVVLWGDPESNAVMKRWGVADWDAKGVRRGDATFDAENHALISVGPSPASPNRYVVLNSGFTFREYDYLNNARQTPKLPDWAVVDVRTPPDSRFPGKVVAAGFYDEQWRLKPER